MLGCSGKAVHKITDAEIEPKRFNGKMICKVCKTVRELLKKEPEVDDDE
jgi:hypothetical protein